MRPRRPRRRYVAEDTEPVSIEETRVYQRTQVTQRRKPRWVKVFGILLGAALLFTSGLAYGFYRYIRSSQDSLALTETGGRINILVLGVDGGVNGKLRKADVTGTRSDVIMVVSIDPQLKEAGILSIPRDTRVYIPEVEDYEKIAHAHAYGGPALAVKTVEQFLKVPIHYYVRVDFEAFKKAVDVLGGVDVYVPQDMDYDDPYQNLYIHIKKGNQHLNGEQALQFVRYRQYDGGDIDRIKAQEEFLKAVIKKASSLSSVLKVPDLIRELSPYIKTDLTTQEMLNLAAVAAGIKPASVQMGIIPGTPQYISDGEYVLSYWIADLQKTAEMVDRFLKGIDREKNASVRIAIENGSGIPGAADSLASILRGQGFQVVSVGNASRQNYTQTRVLAPADRQAQQSLVVAALRPMCSDVKAYRTSQVSGADVLIIIGKDYKKPDVLGGY